MIFRIQEFRKRFFGICSLVAIAFFLTQCAANEQQMEEAVSQEESDESFQDETATDEVSELVEDEATLGELSEDPNEVANDSPELTESVEDVETVEELENEILDQSPVEMAPDPSLVTKNTSVTEVEGPSSDSELATNMQSDESTHGEAALGSANYVVRPGDSLQIVSQRIYGDSSQWKRLAEINGISNPNLIFPGDVVKFELNDASKKFYESYQSEKMAVVTVENGDSLYKIAGKVLGDAKAWKYIWRFNESKISDPKKTRS